VQGLEANDKSMVVVKDGAAARLRYRAGADTIEIRVDARPHGRASVVAQVMRVASPLDVETRRAAWREAFEALRSRLAAGSLRRR
jgi:hypothetical protein